ncbi:nuclear transport factor 2 family protein [Sphingomonas ginsenosidivorax]|uniref:nuclear transport factor 2 family protein n=1 Tax=Sphingomonas ginsenosidivorax TaxID=862135 RepID=UPI001F557CB8|nr:nuclear transport factor 2 family protein [Sphingomonas ginsenosidivorax]
MDWQAIAELKARYCRLLDTRDWTGYAALFSADAVLDTTGSGGPRIEGREAAVAMVRASLDDAVTVHQVHSPEIMVDGDVATAVWAMSDRLRWTNGRRLDGAGHYHERYVRRGGSWLIAETRLTRLFVDMQG